MVVIYPSGGGDLPNLNTSPRAPVGAKNTSFSKMKYLDLQLLLHIAGHSLQNIRIFNLEPTNLVNHLRYHYTVVNFDILPDQSPKGRQTLSCGGGCLGYWEAEWRSDHPRLVSESRNEL